MICAESKAKYLKISPKKLRAVACLLHGKNAEEAMDILRCIPRKAALFCRKALKSAIANAESNLKTPSHHLRVSQVKVDQGPVFKRYQPAPKGSAHPIRKPTSHLSIQLINTAG